eukprot:3551018-Amphidinium_carterae.1
MRINLYTVRRMQKFGLTGNFISGIIPPDILAHSKALVFLSLENNTLTGTLPADAFTSMSLLKTVIFQQNVFSGAVPDMHTLRALSILRYDINSLSGALHEDAVNSWASLHFLGLGTNALTGSLPDRFQVMTALEGVTLQANRFEGFIRDQFSCSTDLGQWPLYANFFAGSLPADGLLGLTSTELLLLYLNSFTGSLPPEVVRSMSWLVSLDIHTNGFSGPLQLEALGTVSLNYFAIDGNRFAGTFPSELLHGLQTLDSVYIHLNEFIGTVPSAMCGSTLGDELGWIGIDQNRFQGPLPSRFATLVNLVTFCTGDNLIEGSIPETLGVHQSSLGIVSFRGLTLRGTLPAPMLQHTLSYRKLTLGHGLEGQFPLARGTFQILSIFNNKFRGNMPELAVGAES